MPRRLARQAAHRLWALRRNTLALLFWLLLATAVSGPVMLFALVAQPARSAGDLAPGEPILATPGFRLELAPLALQVEEAVAVPVTRGGRPAGLLLLGAGTYTLRPDAREARDLRRQTGVDLLVDRFDAAFISLDEEALRALRELARLQPLSDPAQAIAARERAADFLAGQAPLLGELPVGLAQQAHFSVPTRAVLLLGADYGRLQLTFGREVSARFADLGFRTLTFRNPAAPVAASSPLAPGAQRPGTLLVFLTTVAMLLMLVYVLTADLERAPGPQDAPATSTELRLAAGLLAAELLAVYAAEAALVRGTLDFAWIYALFAGLVLTRPAPQRLRLGGVGLSTAHLPRAVLLGLVVGILGHFAATLTPPQGLRALPAPAAAAAALHAFLLTGLTVEIYRRGFIQTALERRYGRRAGLVMTALAVGLAYALPRLALAPAGWPAWLLQGLVILPLTEALFGYMYDRTGTVTAGAVTRGLLELLARLLA